MLSLIKINGMYFSEGPNFLLVWGRNFASGCQNFASGVKILLVRCQNFVTGVQNFVSVGQITELNWCQNKS
jgi:hypothetical protein